MFGRKKKAAEATSESTTTEVEPTTDGAGTAEGPRDFSVVQDTSDLVDLGALLIAPAPDTELRLEVDQASGDVTAVQVAHDDSAVQLQVFAAPRSSGIWDEIRSEIREMISGNGGTVEEVTGPFGTELRTRLAQPGPQGRTVFAPAVFAGSDGPRWFLRAVYSGSAAVDEAARAPFDEVVRRAVVSRGDEPRAPREMLPLQMPQTHSEPAAEPEGDDLKPFERGPEITEVR